VSNSRWNSYEKDICKKGGLKKGSTQGRGLRNQATGARGRFTSKLGQVDNGRHLNEGQD
jgi:hypothetical protein